MPASVAILMGVYNGADYLDAQLQSFSAQSHCAWSLLASDDGSSDGSVELVDRFGAEIPQEVRVQPGPKRGVAMNFLSLLKSVNDDAEFVALSDQDDVWLPDRLAMGVSALTRVPTDAPALFGSASFITDAALKNQTRSPEFHRPPGFRNALVQSIAGGNTMLLNRAGWRLAKEAAAEAMDVGGPVTHDWWLYQLISGAGGHVIRDERPTLLYRQHGGNLFGTNIGWKAAALRLRQVLDGQLKSWCEMNATALGASAHRLTRENRAVLEGFASLSTHGPIARHRKFKELGLYRQGRAGQRALELAAFLGRI